MVRIRIGEGWESDPGVRAGLRAGSSGPRRDAIRSIVDVVAVEVDGVDIGAGRTEGPVAEGVLGLLRAVGRLASGGEHASVPFDDGAVELLLHRRGGQALLSVATLARPARLLAHDVEIDLPRLAEAARAAALTFCDRVAEIAPSARALPELRALLAAATRAPAVAEASRPAVPGTRSRRTRRRPRDASCSFELHDEEGRLSTFRGPGADLASLLVQGRVAFRSPTGEEFLAITGSPYLLFRDLCAAASRLAAAPGAPLSFDLARPGRSATARVLAAGDTVSVDGGEPVRCDPLAFAQAIVEGAADFCSVVRGRARRQAHNALLVDLEQSASSCLTHVLELREGDRASASRRRIRVRREPRASPTPLAPGRLRRVSFRPTTSSEVGPPARDGLFLLPGVLVACGRDRTVGLDPAGGEERWIAPGASQAAASGGRVALLRGDALEMRDAATGSVLWSRPPPPDVGTRSTLVLDPVGHILVASGGSVHAFDAAGGQPAWSFASPGAARVRLLPLGTLLVVAADGGMVHALDPDGRVAWRLRGAGPLATPPVGTARSCLLAFRTPTGATLASVDPSTGTRCFESSLDFTPDGPPLRAAGRIVIAGRVAGDGVVAAIEEDGAHAWTEPSPTGVVPALAPRPGGLLAKGPDGTCAALDREGRTLWIRSAAGRPSPPGNLPPVAVRGLVLVAAEEVEWLDGATGQPVGRVPAHAPAQLAVGDDLATWTLDGDGLLAGARVRGHLAEVGPPPPSPP